MKKYWNQWSSQELLSMHGVELEEDDTNLDHDEDDTNSDQDFYCNRCLDAGCYMCDLK